MISCALSLVVPLIVLLLKKPVEGVITNESTVRVVGKTNTKWSDARAISTPTAINLEDSLLHKKAVNKKVSWGLALLDSPLRRYSGLICN